MIYTQDISLVPQNFGVGDKIRVEKRYTEQNREYVDAEILEKYPHHVLVREIKPELREQDRLRWCIQWKDFVIMGIRK